MQNIVGIDIGGSHITLAQVDAIEKKIISETYIRKHVDSFENKEIIISSWVDAIEKCAENLDKKSLILGIAMPGPFNYKEGISLMQQGKFLDLFNVNIKLELAQRLSISTSQIFFLNDAAAFLEGEIFGGCVQNEKSVFAITLGTGLGTTFYNGKEASDEDLWDSPFKNSISEDYLATRWFVNRYFELTQKEISGTLDLLNKEKDIQTKIFGEYADALSDFIVKYVKDYQPEALVLGGNIAKAYPYFSDRFLNNLSAQGIEIPVKISAIFEDAAILGAASYALKNS